LVRCHRLQNTWYWSCYPSVQLINLLHIPFGTRQYFYVTYEALNLIFKRPLSQIWYAIILNDDIISLILQKLADAMNQIYCT